MRHLYHAGLARPDLVSYLRNFALIRDNRLVCLLIVRIEVIVPEDIVIIDCRMHIGARLILQVDALHV